MGQDRQQRSEALADTLGLPGRFTITVPPRDPATARDRAAIGPSRPLTAHELAQSWSVPLEDGPRRLASRLEARNRAARRDHQGEPALVRQVPQDGLDGRSFVGTAARAATSNPASRSNASAASPEPSARVPWVTPSETVTTAARMPLTHPSCQTRPEPVRTRPAPFVPGADRDGDGGIHGGLDRSAGSGARRRSRPKPRPRGSSESPGRSRTGSNARSRRSRPSSSARRRAGAWPAASREQMRSRPRSPRSSGSCPPHLPRAEARRPE